VKPLSRIVMGGLLLAGATGFAQSPTASANATATILTAISLAKNTDLVFGNISPTGTAGTVVLSPTGTRTPTNVTLASGTSSAASFTATGTGSQTFTITPDSSATLSDGASHTLTVDTFTTSAGAGTLSSGTQTFTLGGTLHVGASQVAGSYTGTFNVTVAYN
jgi:Domain of unknown function (DUF4402)